MNTFATRGDAWFTAAGDRLTRLVMCVVPSFFFSPDQFAIAASFALLLGLSDGFARRWGGCTASALVAEPEGLAISARRRRRVVPWANVSAILNWHHFNRLDFVAVHYRRADGRLEIATCLDECEAEELRAFVAICADHAQRASPRQTITLAGWLEPGVYLPLCRRLTRDVALATAVGLLRGSVAASFTLGLLAASQSLWISAIRQPRRTTVLVQEQGLWCSGRVDARPLRLIPRALRLWVRGLAEAAYRNQSRVRASQSR